MSIIRFLRKDNQESIVDLTIPKTVLITGANGGLGRILVEAFLANDYEVIAHTRVKYDDFEKAFVEFNHRVTFVYADLSDLHSVDECFLNLTKNREKIDIVVHNAAKEHGGYLVMTKLDEIQNIMNINFNSTLRINQLLIKLLKKSPFPSIINISSIAGLDLDSGNIAYGISKASLNASTIVLSKDLSQFGIRVNSIAPGLVMTNMVGKMRGLDYNQMKDRSIIGVLEPYRIANVALFLASETSLAINGQVIRADGGRK